MNELFCEKVFYHVYPLGLFGCPLKNDFCCPAGNGFEIFRKELIRLKKLDITALYIGPVFESSAHGYDTLDYFHVDRRLGNNESFALFCDECHKLEISVVLDAVFNHTGREFFAFKDIKQNGKNSKYKNWYQNLNFDRKSNYGDCFDYDGWAGCKDLVKLNVDNADVRSYLFSAVDFWIDTFKIDGLRLDAADVLCKSFLDALSVHCRQKKENFWLMGEVVHGDYNDWLCQCRLDSVTNYQLYKAMWSALNDKNCFELSYNLEREFGQNGMYKNNWLYNFLDNHDVNRIASNVKKFQHLFLIYGILFCVPGIPSIYYGSEFGIRGQRGAYDDFELRPVLPPFSDKFPDFAVPSVDSASLSGLIAKLAQIRKNCIALQKGSYRLLFVTNQTLVFLRKHESEEVVIAVNCDDVPQKIQLNCYEGSFGSFFDVLNERFYQNICQIEVPANWLLILKKN